MLVFLCTSSVLCVSVKGFEQKTGWESKKSLPLAHDTHFAELRQRMEEKCGKEYVGVSPGDVARLHVLVHSKA